MNCSICKTIQEKDEINEVCTICGFSECWNCYYELYDYHLFRQEIDGFSICFFCDCYQRPIRKELRYQLHQIYFNNRTGKRSKGWKNWIFDTELE